MQAITYGQLGDKKAAQEYRDRLNRMLAKKGMPAFPALAAELQIVFGDS